METALSRPVLAVLIALAAAPAPAQTDSAATLRAVLLEAMASDLWQPAIEIEVEGCLVIRRITTEADLVIAGYEEVAGTVETRFDLSRLAPITESVIRLPGDVPLLGELFLPLIAEDDAAAMEASFALNDAWADAVGAGDPTPEAMGPLYDRLIWGEFGEAGAAFAAARSWKTAMPDEGFAPVALMDVWVESWGLVLSRLDRVDAVLAALEAHRTAACPGQ